MKICIVPSMFPKYNGDYYGPFVFNEAKNLSKKGHEVHVVTPHNEGALYEEIMEGVHVHRFKWLEPKPFKALVYFKGLKDYLRLVTYLISLFLNLIIVSKKFQINILHAHSTIPNGFIAAIVSKIMGIPLFITAHGMDIYNYENYTLFRKIIQFSLNSSVNAIAVSEDLRDRMRILGVNKDKIIILRNAVDKNKFFPKKNNTFRKILNIESSDVVILFVGYLDIFKGIFETLDAFIDISKLYNNVKLIMISSGPKEYELKKIISDSNLEDRVIFAGEISPLDIPKYYQVSDIFVLPSHIKGVPVVVIEAMACGLPVIVSNTEIINNGVNGFLISHNNKDLLVKKLQILINNPHLRKKFSEESIKTIDEEFNIEKKVDKLVNLYKKSK